MLVIAEPTSDYVVEVTVDGFPVGDARGGLVVYQDDSHVEELAKTRQGREPVVRVFSTQGDLFAPGVFESAPGPARIRIERRRHEYTFYMLDERRNSWRRLDRRQPDWDQRLERKLGLTALGTTDSVFRFTDFVLNMQ